MILHHCQPDCVPGNMVCWRRWEIPPRAKDSLAQLAQCAHFVVVVVLFVVGAVEVVVTVVVEEDDSQKIGQFSRTS